MVSPETIAVDEPPSPTSILYPQKEDGAPKLPRTHDPPLTSNSREDAGTSPRTIQRQNRVLSETTSIPQIIAGSVGVTSPSSSVAPAKAVADNNKEATKMILEVPSIPQIATISSASGGKLRATSATATRGSRAQKKRKSTRSTQAKKEIPQIASSSGGQIQTRESLTSHTPGNKQENTRSSTQNETRQVPQIATGGPTTVQASGIASSSQGQPQTTTAQTSQAQARQVPQIATVSSASGGKLRVSAARRGSKKKQKNARSLTKISFSDPLASSAVQTDAKEITAPLKAETQMTPQLSPSTLDDQIPGSATTSVQAEEKKEQTTHKKSQQILVETVVEGESDEDDDSTPANPSRSIQKSREIPLPQTPLVETVEEDSEEEDVKAEVKEQKTPQKLPVPQTPLVETAAEEKLENEVDNGSTPTNPSRSNSISYNPFDVVIDRKSAGTETTTPQQALAQIQEFCQKPTTARRRSQAGSPRTIQRQNSVLLELSSIPQVGGSSTAYCVEKSTPKKAPQPFPAAAAEEKKKQERTTPAAVVPQIATIAALLPVVSTKYEEEERALRLARKRAKRQMIGEMNKKVSFAADGGTLLKSAEKPKPKRQDVIREIRRVPLERRASLKNVVKPKPKRKDVLKELSTVPKVGSITVSTSSPAKSPRGVVEKNVSSPAPEKTKAEKMSSPAKVASAVPQIATIMSLLPPELTSSEQAKEDQQTANRLDKKYGVEGSSKRRSLMVSTRTALPNWWNKQQQRSRDRRRRASGSTTSSTNSRRAPRPEMDVPVNKSILENTRKKEAASTIVDALPNPTHVSNDHVEEETGTAASTVTNYSEDKEKRSVAEAPAATTPTREAIAQKRRSLKLEMLSELSSIPQIGGAVKSNAEPKATKQPADKRNQKASSAMAGKQGYAPPQIATIASVGNKYRNQQKQLNADNTESNDIPQIATIASMAVSSSGATGRKARRRSSTDLPDWWKDRCALQHGGVQVGASRRSSNKEKTPLRKSEDGEQPESESKDGAVDYVPNEIALTNGASVHSQLVSSAHSKLESDCVEVKSSLDGAAKKSEETDENNERESEEPSDDDSGASEQVEKGSWLSSIFGLTTSIKQKEAVDEDVSGQQTTGETGEARQQSISWLESMFGALTSKEAGSVEKDSENNTRGEESESVPESEDSRKEECPINDAHEEGAEDWEDAQTGGDEEASNASEDSQTSQRQTETRGVALSIREPAADNTEVYKESFVTRSKQFKDLCKWAFEVCDADNSGAIDKDELYRGVILVHLRMAKYVGTAATFPASRETIDKLFDASDADNSGTIDEDEFQRIMVVVCGQVASRISLYLALLMVIVPGLAKGTVLVLGFLLLGRSWFHAFLHLIQDPIARRVPWLDAMLDWNSLPEDILKVGIFSILFPIVFEAIDNFYQETASGKMLQTISALKEKDESPETDVEPAAPDNSMITKLSEIRSQEELVAFWKQCDDSEQNLLIRSLYATFVFMAWASGARMVMCALLYPFVGFVLSGSMKAAAEEQQRRRA